jgi:hypothetical protein
VAALLEAVEPDPRVALAHGGYERRAPGGADTELVYPAPHDPLASLGRRVVPAARMFRMRDFHRAGGFDETLEHALDFDLILKLAEAGEVRTVERVIYRLHRAEHEPGPQSREHIAVVEAARERRARPAVEGASRGLPARVVAALLRRSEGSV